MRALAARHGVELGALALILVLASTLRFVGLADRGLIYWDEGKFALEGIRLESALQLLTGVHANLLAGKAVGTGKPMHALLIALAYAAFGIHDYVALLVNAVAAVVSVALTYVIGRLVFGAVAGLLAAGLLAVSEYDIIYARSALSESDATMFLLAGVAIWLSLGHTSHPAAAKHALLGPVLAGFVLGIGFTTNYRLIVYIGVVVAIDLVRSAYSLGPRVASLRLVGWAAGLLIAPLLWQIGGVAAENNGLVVFRGELVRAPLPYWREVVYQLHEGKQSVLHFDPVIYLRWWVLRQGWLVSLLLLAAVLRAFWVRSAAWLLPTTLVVLPYLVYVFAPFVVPRNLVPALPFASILVAGLLVEAARSAGAVSRTLVTLISLLLLGLGAFASWRLTGVHSGFALATRYVEQHDRGRALTSSEVPVFYLRGAGPTCNAPALPSTTADLRGYIRQGYHYAILDRHNNSSVTVIIRRDEPQVARFSAFGNVQIGESLISSENSNPPTGDTRTEYVNVYYLDPGRLPPGRPGRAVPCQRDGVV